MDYIFDAKNEKVDYTLDEYSCYEKLTKTCSLYLEKPTNNGNIKPGYSGTFEYCREMAAYMKGIEESPITKKVWGTSKASIFITRDENGVWKVTDGQHRICVAQKLELLLMVNDGKD